MAHNRWFHTPTTVTTSAYNIRSPAYPQLFHDPSTDGGTAWTWTAMIRNLWEQMLPLGEWPGLPYAPIGTPEGFWLQGVAAWPALCDILDHLGMTVACDLQQDSPFSIVRQGGDDTALTDTQNRYALFMEDDQEWIDTGAARVPARVKVFFPRRNSIYGTEETVRRDSLQWSMTTAYSVTVNAPIEFVNASGTHHIWSDFTVRYDHNNIPLTDDTNEATLIATERVTQYYDRIDPDNFMTRTYAGALPFATGSLVDGVCWYMDFTQEKRAGWRTETVYGPPQAPWPGLWDDWK